LYIFYLERKIFINLVLSKKVIIYVYICARASHTQTYIKYPELSWMKF